MIKAFVDASVFFSACYSEEGASYAIFRQALEGKVQLVISEFVLRKYGAIWPRNHLMTCNASKSFVTMCPSRW